MTSIKWRWLRIHDRETPLEQLIRLLNERLKALERFLENHGGGSASDEINAVEAYLYNAGDPLVAGDSDWVFVPFSFTITLAEIVADAAGSITVDVYASSYSAWAGFSLISASAPVSLSGTAKAHPPLTGWTKTFTGGTYLRFTVSGTPVGIRKATVSLQLTLPNSVLVSDTGVMVSGAAGGVLSGTYPNPGFAEDMATQAELNAEASARSSADSTEASARIAGDAFAIQRSNHTGTQTASTISDFAESVDDRVAALLVAGSNVTLTYNDAGDTLTIASSGGGGGGGGTVTAVRVKNSSAQSIANSTNVALTFDTEVYDAGGLHSTSSNTDRLTVPSGMAGKYRVWAVVGYASNASGARAALLQLNGTTEIGGVVIPTTGGAFGTYVHVSTTVDLAVGDYVRVLAFQSSGGALNTENFQERGCLFGMELLLASGGSGSVTPDTQPTSPNAADDEFEQTTGTGLDTTGARRAGATAWAWRNQGGATFSQDSGYGILTGVAQTTSNLRIVEQVVGAGPWTYRCKLRSVKVAAASNFSLAGLCVANSGSGKVIGMYKGYNGGIAVAADRWTNVTTFSANLLVTTLNGAHIVHSMNDAFYIEIALSGTNLIFRYSLDGVVWTTGVTEALATFITSVDRIGLIVHNDTNANLPIGVYDWFRRTA